jgi:hypothetical protein
MSAIPWNDGRWSERCTIHLLLASSRLTKEYNVHQSPMGLLVRFITMKLAMKLGR